MKKERDNTTPARKGRARKPAPAQSKAILIGIGASAGGLEALSELMEVLPLAGRLCYVVAQHVSPTHDSLLQKLLAARTSLVVRDVVDGVLPEPGVVYITPPNHDVLFEGGCLRLVDPHNAVGPKPSINRLFASLAEGFCDQSVGIVLSGTGSDGAEGIRAIKAAGGLTIAQEQRSARYDGMPKAAIHTGAVDLVLRPAEIGGTLARLYLDRTHNPALVQEEPVQAAGDYEQICNLVRTNTAFRLSDYKPATIQRRIARRMKVRGVSTPPDYLELLRKDRNESRMLVRDTFISVTSFFRDDDAFAGLRQMLPGLLEKLEENTVLRCWVPGCATGEEAYSIAMVLDDSLREIGRPDRQFMIFASDMDEEALTRAREASYSMERIERLPPAFQARYMEVSGSLCRVSKHIRNRVVFARQNVIEDPPFSRLDLISCRNLVIYLSPDAQRRVQEIFHYALNANGILFVGKSETADKDLFEAMDASAKLYRRRDGRFHYALPMLQSAMQSELPKPARSKPSKPVDQLTLRTLEGLVSRFAPPSLIINAADSILHMQGELKPFLDFPRGNAELNLFDMLCESLRIEMRALIYRCRREMTTVFGSRWPIEIDGARRAVTLNVSPLDEENDRLLLVSFLVEQSFDMMRHGSRETGPGSAEAIISELEREVANSRGQLRGVVEELETANQDLQSLNEQLQSANEELQSLNEELQTSNEELQSSNEELITVNDELQAKTIELERVATDLINVKESLTLPMMVLNVDLRVTAANPACEQVLDADFPLEGCSFRSLKWRIDVPRLSRHIRGVIRTGEPYALDLFGKGDCCFHLNVMPYRDARSDVRGAVLLFEDVTAMGRMVRQSVELRHQYETLFHFSPDGFVVVDPASACILDCNHAAQEMLGRTRDNIIGQPVWMFSPPLQANGESSESYARQRIGHAEKMGSHHCESLLIGHDGAEFFADITVSLVVQNGEKVLLESWRDISRRKTMERELIEGREHLQMATRAAELGVWVRDLVTNKLQFDERQHEIYQSPEAVRRDGPEYAFWRSRVHRKDIDAVEKALANAVNHGQSFSARFRIVLPDGRIRHIQSAAMVARDEDGRPTRLVGINRDLTEQILAEESLRESEQRFRQVAESLPQLVWTCEPDGACDYLSPQWMRYTGVSESEQLGFGWLQQIHPDDRQRTMEHWQATASQGNDFAIEFRIRRHDGVYRWFRTLAVALRDRRRRIVKWFGSNTDIEDIKAAQRQLEEGQLRLGRIIDLMPEAILLVNEAGVIEQINQRAEEIFGYSRQELLGESVDMLVPAAKRAAHADMRQGFSRAPSARQMGMGRELYAVCKDGREFPVEAGLALLQEGTRQYVIVSVADCTVRRDAEKQLRLAANVFDNTLDGILIAMPDLSIVTVNPAFEQILGYAPDEVIGRSLKDLQSDRHDERFFVEIQESLATEGSWQGEVWERRKDGRVVPLWISISTMRDSLGRAERHIATLYDITDQKVSQERINYLAHYDVLTDIPNRTLFNDRLKHALQNASRIASRLALIFIDIDNFKQVNDTLGHTAGDALLCIVAERIKASTRESDTVGRLGGDEFLVLIENVDQQVNYMHVAQKILEALSAPMNVGYGDFCISASMGISCYPEDGRDAGALLKNADLAMYRSKSSGKNQIHFYDEEMSAAAIERMELQTELLQALDAGRLELHYQPIVDVKSRRYVGVEALARWAHATRGAIPPSKFIAAAEESALIHQLGAWVLRSACRQMKRWADEGLGLEFMAVNVSGKQIMQADFVGLAQQILLETGCDPRLITLELTESFVMHESREAIQRLERLRSLGFGIAIDDFGTGYSSLAYLKRLPVSKLKLDRSFVCDIPGDNNDAAIARAVLKLGESVGLDVVAEGVETEAQHRFLLEEGCRYSQGYFYSKPASAQLTHSLLS